MMRAKSINTIFASVCVFFTLACAPRVALAYYENCGNALAACKAAGFTCNLTIGPNQFVSLDEGAVFVQTGSGGFRWDYCEGLPTFHISATLSPNQRIDCTPN